MKKETDPFKEAIRNKLPDKPIATEADGELWNKVLSNIQQQPKVVRINHIWYAAAASILLIMSIPGVIYFYTQSKSDNNISLKDTIVNSTEPMTEQRSDNSPAGNNPNIKHDSHAESMPQKSVPNTSIPTLFSNSEQLQAENKIESLTLADGSIVTLNTNSNIKIDKVNVNERNLSLQGEGFFEIQPDKSKPCHVYFSHYKLTVTGTKFNIRSLPAEGFSEVTVIEGSVKVYDNKTAEGISLEIGDQLRIEEGHETILNRVVPNHYIAWKSRSLDFKNTQLGDVAYILSRIYHQEIILSGSIKKCRFTGDVSGLNLSETLEVIKLSTSLKIENSDKKVYITGSGCD